MTHRIAISIINYRTGDMTLNCVRSVLHDMEGVDGSIIVVDNASGDGSAEQVAAWIAAQPENTPVELVQSTINSGFSGGHNQGIAACDADYYLVLNSDAILRPGFLKAILTTAEAHPEAGLIAPRLEGEDGEPQVSSFRFQSPFGELIRGASSGPVTRVFQRHVVPLGTDPDPTQIEWASFACILLNARMIADIGPMDEGYFLYFEDAEYCLRARRKGWGIVHAPQAIAVHYRGGSGPVKAQQKARKRLPAYFYSSRSRFLYQAYGHAGLLTANVLWFLGRGIAQLRRLAGKSVPPANEAEACDIWTNAWTPLGPRNPTGE
jgi:N-acetylglucosaminyl-diphospho-decaprenol L-rhamnosyltransferase